MKEPVPYLVFILIGFIAVMLAISESRINDLEKRVGSLERNQAVLSKNDEGTTEVFREMVKAMDAMADRIAQ